MKRLPALVILTFLQNITLLLVGEGAYFYAHHELQFSDRDNLMLALGRGLVYVAAALCSHGVCRRLGERRTLGATMLMQVVCYGVICIDPRNPMLLVGGLLGYNTFAGMKWPVIETYFSAGLGPKQTLKALGYFNMAWATSAPLGMMLAGPVIEFDPAMLFIISIVADVLCIGLLVMLEARPAHLALDHPDRPPPAEAKRNEALLKSTRWSLMISYAMFYMISPLLPGILAPLVPTLAMATFCAALLHVGRWIIFIVMWRIPNWHGKAGIAAGAIVTMPLGFAMIMSEHSLAIVIAGQFVFGAGAGLCYYAALYYAMVIKNSSVDASGKHEAAIGSGLIVGPVVGLLAMQFGAAAVFAPFIVAAVVVSALPLRRSH